MVFEKADYGNVKVIEIKKADKCLLSSQFYDVFKETETVGFDGHLKTLKMIIQRNN